MIKTKKDELKSRLCALIPAHIKQKADVHCAKNGLFLSSYITSLIEKDLTK